MRKDRWLWAILILAAAVRLYSLGERSLSYDECRQYWASRGNVLISNRETTVDPPLFAALLRFHAPGGRDETWLRLLPCLCGILAVRAVYHLAGAAGGNQRTARMAAFFFALAPFPIRFSQSLGPGSLTLLLGALVPAAFLSALEAGRPRAGALLAFLLCASLVTQYGAVWLLAAMALILVSRASRGSPAAPLRTALALALGGAAALPFYLLSLPAQLRRDIPLSVTGDGFTPAEGFLPALRFIFRGTFDLLGTFSLTRPVAGAAFGLLAVFGIARLARRRAGAAAATLLLSAIGAAVVATALWSSPFGGIRQMQFAAPLFAVCVAAGIDALHGRLRGIPTLTALAAIAVGSGLFLARYHAAPRGREIRGAAQFLESAAQPGDGVFVSKDAIPQFRFYYRGSGETVVYGKETVSRDYLSEINRVLPGRPEVFRWWLVFFRGWSPARRRELAGVDPHFVPGERFETQQAAAYLFIRREGPSSRPRDGGALP